MAPVHDNAERDVALAKLRRESPIHWDAVNEWWLITRHADVREISRHPEIFSSEPKGPWHVFEHRFSMQAMSGATRWQTSVADTPIRMSSNAPRTSSAS